MVEINGNDQEDVPYTIEGDKLLSNEDTMKIIYIAQITDPGAFRPLFIKALGAHMAHVMAYSITNSRTVEAQKKEDYLDIIEDALAVDSQDVPVNTVQKSDWLDGRRGGDGKDNTRSKFLGG